MNMITMLNIKLYLLSGKATETPTTIFSISRDFNNNFGLNLNKRELKNF